MGTPSNPPVQAFWATANVPDRTGAATHHQALGIGTISARRNTGQLSGPVTNGGDRALVRRGGPVACSRLPQWCGAEFDLEPVGVLEIGRVVVRAAGVRVAIPKHQRPAVLGAVVDESIDVCLVSAVER